MEGEGTWDGGGATLGSKSSPRTMLPLDLLRRSFEIITRLTGDGGVGVLGVIAANCAVYLYSPFESLLRDGETEQAENKPNNLKAPLLRTEYLVGLKVLHTQLICRRCMPQNWQ
jgi:hypothetical protein